METNAATLTGLVRCEAIGIDVSKASLAVVGLTGAGVRRCRLDNTVSAIEGLARALSGGGYRGKVICEATGHYHLLLGVVMSRYGLDLRVVNPLQSSKHQKARVRRTKTDGVDGAVLATMALTERELPGPARLRPAGVRVRLIQGQLQGLDKQLQALSASVATYRRTHEWLGLPLTEAQGALSRVVSELRDLKRDLERELEALLVPAVADREELARLEALPGYSRLVSGLVGTVFDRQAPSERSWVAYCGLDVSVRQSGTWRGRGKLTKRGNSYIRKRLYHAAWGATMNYPEVRRYYDALKAKGRNHVEALCIIARKLLRIAYAILVKGKTYDPTIAFPA